MKDSIGIAACALWILVLGVLWTLYWKQIIMIFVVLDASVIATAFMVCLYRLVCDVITSSQTPVQRNELPCARVVSK